MNRREKKGHKARFNQKVQLQALADVSEQSKGNGKQLVIIGSKSKEPFTINKQKMSKTTINYRSNSLVNLIDMKPSNLSRNNSIQIEQGKNNIKAPHRETVLSSQRINKKFEVININDSLNEKKNSDRKPSSDNKSNSTNKFRMNEKSSRTKSKKSNKPFSLNPNESVPDQILGYLKKRQDVQIVDRFDQYKNQFYTKSKFLHNYIENSEQPEKIRNNYLNEGDSHFRNGLQAIMLKLFRDGTIVPQSYNNLRQSAVDEIQKWVIGWIHRKIMYGKLQQDEDNQVLVLENTLDQVEDYKRKINSENTSF